MTPRPKPAPKSPKSVWVRHYVIGSCSDGERLYSFAAYDRKFRGARRYDLPSPDSEKLRLEKNALEAVMLQWSDKPLEYVQWAAEHDLYRIRPLAKLELFRRENRRKK